MVEQHTPHSSFGKWLLKYRLLIIIISFVVLIPLAFIISLYVGDYIRYSQVKFSDDEVIKNFQSFDLTHETSTNHEELNFITDDFTLKIKLKAIVLQQYSDEDGSYTFRAKQVKTSENTISQVSVTFILQADWINAKSEAYTFTPQTAYNTNHSLVFNQKFPVYPLLFITVNAPNLYVKITYNVSYPLGGSDKKTNYYKANLYNLTPTDVYDELHK